LFIFGAAAFADYENYQLPAYSTRIERQYRTYDLSTALALAGGTYSAGNAVALGTTYLPPTVYRTAACRTCPSYGQVNPTFKYFNSFVQTFKPVGATVLISYSADDEGIGINQGNGQTAPTSSESTLLTGIVVTLGTGLTSTRLAEGQRVYFSPQCAVSWTTATWTATYGPEKATMMNGKFQNGVDLNNADGWLSNFNYASPAMFYGGQSNPSYTTFNEGNLHDYSFSGDTIKTSGTTISAAADSSLPTNNPNQQANYLLCSEAMILGIVSENSFPNVDGGHYELPQTALRGLRNPAAYSEATLISQSNA
jgi:hypothetical protein